MQVLTLILIYIALAHVGQDAILRADCQLARSYKSYDYMGNPPYPALKKRRRRGRTNYLCEFASIHGINRCILTSSCRWQEWGDEVVPVMIGFYGYR
jgi:hypothetical protein